MSDIDESIGLPGGYNASGVLTPDVFGLTSANLLSDVSSTPPDTTDAEALFQGRTWSYTTLTYSFPQLSSDYDWISYGGGYEPFPDFFIPMEADGRAILTEVFDQWSIMSGLDLVLETGTDEADIQVAGTTVTETAWAYGPGTSTRNGDIWFNLGKSYFKTLNDSSAGHIGGYAYSVALHEAGHALGLKHPHEGMTANPKVLAVEYDSLEFSVMSYRSYVGDPSAGNYSNERWGYPQSLMMLDIAAMQQLYGASYDQNAGDTHYYFDPATGEMVVDGISAGMPGANRLFRTIWDGDGNDTLDFSDYSTDLRVDLQAGAGTDVDVGGNLQRARLGKSNGDSVYATNHLYMSLLFDQNTASLIENAIGGTGADILIGNEIANLLRGGLGADLYTLGNGADTVAGSLAEIDGDGITDFTAEDAILVEGLMLANEQLQLSGSGELSIDGDGDGVFESGMSVGTGGAVTLRADKADSDTLLSIAGANEIALSGQSESYWYSGSVGQSVDANGGDDVVVGGAGNDNIMGGEGSDFIVGGAGNDTIEGGGAIDSLTGGTGDDTFVFRAGETSGFFTLETVFDFVPGSDKIYLDGFAATNMAELGILDTSSGAVLPLSPTHYVTLKNVSAASLTANDFVFAPSESGFGLIGSSDMTVLSDLSEQFTGTGGGDLSIDARGGDDVVVLSGGNDTIYGGSGSDLLYGYGGNDRILGGLGSDRVTGGAGADTFVFDAADVAAESGFALDYISDFVLGLDMVEMIGFGNVAAGDFQMFDAGPDVYMMLSSTQGIVFDNVAFDSAALVASDAFTFV